MPIAPGARFCAQCGLASDLAPQGAAAPASYVQAGFRPRSQPVWPWVAGSLVAAGLALAGLRATGSLQFGSRRGDPALSARDRAAGAALGLGSGAPAPGLANQASIPPPALAASSSALPPTLGQTAPTMPDDVRAWLEWLAEIEKEKQTLTRREERRFEVMVATLQGSGGLSAADVRKLTDPDSSGGEPAMEDAQSAIKELIKDWHALDSKFQTRKPPTECAAIAAAYGGGLEGMADGASQLEDTLTGVASMSDPTQDDADAAIGKAKGVGRSHVHSVDELFTSADQQVGEICDKYDTRKWFSIDAHGGSTNLLGGF